MSTELVQLLGIAVGVCVIVGLVVGAVKLSNAAEAIWPNCASKFDLAFDEQKQGNALTAQRRVKSLVGTVQGVSLRLLSTWEVVGNTRRTSFAAHARALHPAPHRLSLMILRGAHHGQPYHVVPTGDAAFDRAFTLKSDAPDLVRALVTPAVRAAISQLPMSEVVLTYDNGELCLSHGREPFAQAELESVIGVVVAAGQAKLA